MFRCNEEGCSAEFKNERWAKTQASDWFHQRDGTVYCPDHIPDWVYEWRARKNGTTTKQEREIAMPKKAANDKKNAPKVHLPRPTNEGRMMCGKTKGLDTDKPAKVTCVSCKKLYTVNQAWYRKTKSAATKAAKKLVNA